MASTPSSRLAGKVALITGAGSGIGEATSLLFAGEGARIYAVDVNAETVKRTAHTIAQGGGEAAGPTEYATREPSCTEHEDWRVRRLPDGDLARLTIAEQPVDHWGCCHVPTRSGQGRV